MMQAEQTVRYPFIMAIWLVIAASHCICAENAAAQEDWRSDLKKASTYVWESADLMVGVRVRPRGAGRFAELVGIVHKASGRWLSKGGGTLFGVTMKQDASQKAVRLSSAGIWKTIAREGDELVFRGPLQFPDAPEVTCSLLIVAHAEQEDIRLSWKGQTGHPSWHFMDVSVGSVELERTDGWTVFYPSSMGEKIAVEKEKNIRKIGSYPGLYCTMPWMAAWKSDEVAGLYVAAHDPTGANKTVRLISKEGEPSAVMEIAYVLPVDSREPEKMVAMDGQIVWKAFRGNWYDAALIYRDWVRRNASWFPQMGPEGRRSTPDWFKRLNVILRVFGNAKEAVAHALEAQKVIGLPIGVHWYRWHQIPFDNDYPHYFPPKDGFEEGIKALHAAGIKVWPYTNGRLWDHHDRENEDWEFSAKGKAGACKHADGTLFTEFYRSKEKDGSKVIFSPMCPASAIWKQTVADNNRKIVMEYGMDGCYMDQIGACSPVLCEDPLHGHPLRGGHWWAQEYRHLLSESRKSLTKDIIFMTECNSETVMDQMDAMVCWHIEGDYQRIVPAFAVVYSGAVFMVGRSTPNNPRAMRMKWANNLMNGDIPGWFSIGFVREKSNLDYLKPLLQFRSQVSEFMYKGELCRPPVLLDPLPLWTENWDLFGKKADNTMPIVQTAMRRIMDYDYDADGRRLWDSGRLKSALILFTNFSDEEASSRIQIDWKELGLKPDNVRLTKIDESGHENALEARALKNAIHFPPRQSWGIRIERK